MKFIEPRPFADPEVAARKLLEHCQGLAGAALKRNLRGAALLA